MCHIFDFVEYGEDRLDGGAEIAVSDCGNGYVDDGVCEAEDEG